MDPKVDGMPLYTRIDNGIDEVISKNKTEAWERASENSYCSPTNVRRVIISGDKVLINTYKPVIKGGKPASYGCWREVSLGEDSLFNAIKTQLNQNSTDRVRIKGGGLGVIHRPWACTNIEELYIDISILFSEDYQEVPEIRDLTIRYLQGARGKINSELMEQIVETGFNCEIDKIKTLFPRLKHVSLISELSGELLSNMNRGKQNVDTLEDSKQLFLSLGNNAELLKASNSMLGNLALNFTKGFNTSFEVRDGIYKFDREYLRDYVDGYLKKIREHSLKMAEAARKRQAEADRRQEEEETEETKEVVGTADKYVEEIHGTYRKQVEDMILSTWRSMYKNHVDGTDVIDGLLIPSGVLSNDKTDMRYSGSLLPTKGKIQVRPNTLSNAIWDEFVGACNDAGIKVSHECLNDGGTVAPYTYNPLLQKMVASGEINQKSFLAGWKEYEKALKACILEKTKEIAVNKVKTGSDEYMYNEFSGYTIALAFIDYKDGLGTKLRVCCGDTSKTEEVAYKLVERLRKREKSHYSIGGGKMVLTNPSIASDKRTFVLDVYLDIKGYQAVPKFMGELLVNLDRGQFKPSIDNMIIGVDTQNNIVTAPFTKWLIPIIAGSRSGKGVLTLSMLLNVIGTGAPLFYLDGKPDMSTLLWKLQKKYGIEHSIVVDGISYKGITPIDRKEYIAPYESIAVKALKDEKNLDVMEDYQSLLIYLKTMQVVLLSNQYYRDNMGTKYGNIFLVLDEVYAIIQKKMSVFINSVDREISKCSKDEKERKSKLILLRGWVGELLSDYMAQDIGVFGSGIKAVALTQFAQSTQYKVTGFTEAENFCNNFLLKRAVKLFGRQEGGVGTYGVSSNNDADRAVFPLYDEFYHFGIGSEQGNTYSNLKTFKPLLVLNENDCKELTGKDEDGAFAKDMVARVSKYTNIDKFRSKYFSGNKDLAEAIGFEGALKQVARLLGEDANKMLKLSLERAYDIAEEALEYFGIIDGIHINNVYEYICSCRIDFLWNTSFITKSRTKGISLYNDGLEPEKIEKSNKAFDSVPFEFEDDNNEYMEYEDRGQKILSELSENKDEEQYQENQALFNRPINRTSASQNKLRDEDELILQQVEKRREARKKNNEQREETIAFNSEKNIEKIKESQSKPFVFKSNGEQAFNGGLNNTRVYINPKECEKAIEFTEDNSVTSEDEYKEPKRVFFKSYWGTNYEFNSRWKQLLNNISSKINRTVVTRVMILQDELVVNGKYVCLYGVTGGYENIRLEDLVNIKLLFKQFPNISELALDEIILEKISTELNEIPQELFYKNKLMRLSLIRSDGTKEIITRNNMNKSKTVDESRYANNFESVCARSNPRLNEKDAGYRIKTWNMVKTIGKNGARKVQKELFTTSGSPIKGVFAGITTLAAIGTTAVAGVGKSIFNFIRNGRRA